MKIIDGNDDELLSVRDIAKRTGQSEPTVYRRLKKVPHSATERGNRRWLWSDIKNNLPQVLGKSFISLSNIALAKSSADLPNFGELGVSTSSRWGTSVTSEKLRELQGREGQILLHEMAVNDPIIAAVFFAIENLIRNVSWRVKPVSDSIDDVESAAFLESCFADMSFSFSDTLQFILGELEQGYSILETVWKRRTGPDPKAYTIDPASSQYDDGRIGWRKWAPRPPDSLTYGKEFELDETGGIQAIHQSVGDRNVDRRIPIEKLLLFRTTVAPSNDPRGKPIHRAAYTSWWYSNNIQEIEGIGIERDLAGIPVVYLGRGTRLHGSDNDMDKAKQIAVNLRNDEQAGVVFPYPKLGTGAEGEGVLLELLSSAGRRQYATSDILARYNRLKAISMLSMFIMLGMDQVGSFALSKTQSDLFSIAVSGWLKSISDVINRHAIPRLFSYNVFPKITKLPTWVPSDVGLPNLEDLATYVNQLVLAKVIVPDAELERHLRHVARLPTPQPRTDAEPLPEDSEAAQDTMREQMLTASRASTVASRINRLINEGLIDSVRGQQLIDEAMAQADTALGTLDEDTDINKRITLAIIEKMGGDTTQEQKVIEDVEQ